MKLSVGESNLSMYVGLSAVCQKTRASRTCGFVACFDQIQLLLLRSLKIIIRLDVRISWSLALGLSDKRPLSAHCCWKPPVQDSTIPSRKVTGDCIIPAADMKILSEVVSSHLISLVKDTWKGSNESQQPFADSGASWVVRRF